MSRASPAQHSLSELAARVHAVIAAYAGAPNSLILTRLFEHMYFASLHSEEMQRIAFHVVYLDPDRPDPRPPQRIVQDRWSYIPLEHRVPLDLAEVTKLASATDPKSSSLAIYHNNAGHLFVWGLVDQG